MVRTIAVVIAAMAGLGMTGCGTAYNLSEGRVPYGGVRLDAEQASASWKTATAPGGFRQPPIVDLGNAAIFALDMPISAVADTLTLPIALLAEEKKKLEPHLYPNEQELREQQKRQSQNLTYDGIQGGIE